MKFLYNLSPKIFSIILRIKINHLTFLGIKPLIELAYFCHYNELKKIPGIIIETGAALGGSSIVITASKNQSRPFYVYDIFERIPPPGEMDGEDAHQRFQTILSGEAKGFGKKPYYGYMGNLVPRVIEQFNHFGYSVNINNVYLKKGLIEDTLNVNQPVSLAHIDCDWYSPVKTSLERIAPFISMGGRFIVDDYDHWSGARKAVDEFLSSQTDFQIERYSRLHLVKIK